MKKLIFTLLLLCLFMGINVSAEELMFQPVGGGKFIYCNNQEGIFDTTLLNGENPTYIMNNENLTEDVIYFTH